MLPPDAQKTLLIMTKFSVPIKILSSDAQNALLIILKSSELIKILSSDTQAIQYNRHT